MKAYAVMGPRAEFNRGFDREISTHSNIFSDWTVRRTAISLEPSNTSRIMIAEQTIELALGALPARQLNARVTGVAFWADDIRLAHSQNMQWGKVNFQPIRLPQSN